MKEGYKVLILMTFILIYVAGLVYLINLGLDNCPTTERLIELGYNLDDTKTSTCGFYLSAIIWGLFFPWALGIGIVWGISAE